MNFRKLSIFAICFLLLSSIAIVPDLGAAESPTDDPEPDNEPVYFQAEGTPSEDFKTTYGDVTEQDAYDGPFELAYTGHGIHGWWWDNGIALSSRVETIMEGAGSNWVYVNVSATGWYEYSEYNDLEDITTKPNNRNDIDYSGVTQIPLQVELTKGDCNDLYFEPGSHTAVNMTDGPEGGDEDEDRSGLRDTAEFGIEWAAGLKDPIGAIDIGEFLYEQWKARGASDHDGIEDILPPDDNSDSGKGAFIQQTWDHKYELWWDTDQPYFGQFNVATEFLLKVPTSSLPDEARLEISTKNIFGTYHRHDGLVNHDIGAEASVEIPIRNAEPELDEDEITVEYDEPVKTSDSRYSDCIRPEIEIGKGFIDNPAGCEKAEYNVTVKYSIDEEDWKELTTETMTITDSAELNPYIEIDDEEPEGEMYLEFHVSTKDEYGAWMQELDKDVNFDWVQCDYRLDLEKFEIESDHMESYSITTHDDSFTWSESIHVIMEYPDKYGEQFDETFIRIDWGNGEIVEHYICDWDPGEGVFDDTVENEYEFPEEGSYSYTVEIEIYTDNLWRDIKMFHLSIDYEEQGMRCPVCGGPFGECTCGGPMSTEPDATLEREEYEHHLEEGMISLELFLALSREDLEHIRMRSELTRVEEGWLITYEGEEKYGIELEEKKLAIYALDGEPC